MSGRFVLKTSDNQFQFNLKAGGNSEIILTSERYTRKASALDGIESIRTNSAIDSRFQRKTSIADQPYFVLVAGNGEILGTSEMYSSTAARDGGIAAVKNSAPLATLHDHT